MLGPHVVACPCPLPFLRGVSGAVGTLTGAGDTRVHTRATPRAHTWPGSLTCCFHGLHPQGPQRPWEVSPMCPSRPRARSPPAPPSLSCDFTLRNLGCFPGSCSEQFSEDGASACLQRPSCLDPPRRALCVDGPGIACKLETGHAPCPARGRWVSLPC